MKRLYTLLTPCTTPLCVLVALWLFAGIAASSQTTPPRIDTKGTATTLYIENKGQIGDQHGKPNHDVRFLMRYGTLAVQLRTEGFSYDQYTTSPTNPSMLNVRRIDVDFVNPSPAMRVVSTTPSADRLHYFTHVTQQVHGDKGATDVRGYASVTYHEVWPGIDIEWQIDAQGRPQYRFALSEGTDSSNIRLRVRGNQTFDHHAMVANAHPVPLVSTHRDGFMKPFAGTRWGTYIGGGASNRALAVATTRTGDVVVAGLTMADPLIATSGAFQSEVLGETWDAFVMVLSAEGATRRWGTYLGGGLADVATSVAVMENGDVVVGGETQSPAGIASSGSHQANLGGGFDGFVAVVSADGASRRWATYLGGAERDAINAVRVTPQGAIVAAGTTQSPSGIATAGTHQIGYAGATDGFAVSFSSEGQRQWGSYFGGAGTDEVLAVSARGSAIVIGGTTGSRTNIASLGAFQATYGGGTEDGFVAVLDGTSGALRWASYLGGEGFDVVLGVDERANGDIIVGGETRSTSGLATTGAIQASNAGGRGDGFVGVVAFDGADRRWVTYLGGEQVDGVYAVTAMAASDVVVVGRTASVSGVATPDATQPTLAGGEDGFIAVYRANGSEKTYSSYVGGTANDAATAVASATPGNAVVVGRTLSADGIGTAGSFQTQLGGEFDAFCVGYSDLPLRIQQHEHYDAAIRAWPIPATNELHVRIMDEGAASLTLYNIIGREASPSKVVQHAHTGHVEQLNLDGLSPGLYILQYRSATREYSICITVVQ